jgi:hypothetical protein
MYFYEDGDFTPAGREADTQARRDFFLACQKLSVDGCRRVLGSIDWDSDAVDFYAAGDGSLEDFFRRAVYEQNVERYMECFWEDENPKLDPGQWLEDEE